MRHPTRRHLLGLSAMIPTLAMTGRSHAAARPSFIFFHTPNGFCRESFGADGNEATFKLRPSLAALEPWKSQLSVVRGLCNKSTDVRVGYTQTSRLLTCANGPDKDQAYNTSLDQIVAKKRGMRALNLLALAESGHVPVCPLSWIAPQFPASNVQDNAALWNALFAATPGNTAVPGRQQLVQEFLTQSFERNYRALPGSEKERVNAHIGALGELASRSGCFSQPPFAVEVAAALPQALNAENLQKNGRAKIDMLLAAMVCGTQPATTLAWQPPGPGGLNPISNLPNHFELSQKTDVASVAERKRIDAWYAAQFAYLIDGLAKKNLLDNTIVVWGSEVAEGQHHNNMTFVVAGGKALGIKPQVTVVVPFTGDEAAGHATAQITSNRSIADLWLTVLMCLGMPQTSFGDAPAASLTGLVK